MCSTAWTAEYCVSMKLVPLSGFDSIWLFLRVSLVGWVQLRNELLAEEEKLAMAVFQARQSAAPFQDVEWSLKPGFPSSSKFSVSEDEITFGCTGVFVILTYIELSTQGEPSADTSQYEIQLNGLCVQATTVDSGVEVCSSHTVVHGKAGQVLTVENQGLSTVGPGSELLIAQL